MSALRSSKLKIRTSIQVEQRRPLLPLLSELPGWEHTWHSTSELLETVGRTVRQLSRVLMTAGVIVVFLAALITLEVFTSLTHNCNYREKVINP